MRDFDRRQLLRGASMIGGGMAVSAMLPSWAQSATPGLVSTLPTVSGENIAMTIGHTPFKVDGRMGHTQQTETEHACQQQTLHGCTSLSSTNC